MNRYQRKLNREVRIIVKDDWICFKDFHFQSIRREVKRQARLNGIPCENCDNMHCKNPNKTFICLSQR
jgi:hypothetical protein